jgi:hypothetical protein
MVVPFFHSGGGGGDDGVDGYGGYDVDGDGCGSGSGVVGSVGGGGGAGVVCGTCVSSICRSCERCEKSGHQTANNEKCTYYKKRSFVTCMHIDDTPGSIFTALKGDLILCQHFFPIELQPTDLGRLGPTEKIYVGNCGHLHR